MGKYILWLNNSHIFRKLKEENKNFYKAKFVPNCRNTIKMNYLHFGINKISHCSATVSLPFCFPLNSSLKEQ